MKIPCQVTALNGDALTPIVGDDRQNPPGDQRTAAKGGRFGHMLVFDCGKNTSKTRQNSKQLVSFFVFPQV